MGIIGLLLLTFRVMEVFPDFDFDSISWMIKVYFSTKRFPNFSFEEYFKYDNF